MTPPVTCRVEDHQIPVSATTPAVAPQVFTPAPQTLLSWERLVAAAGGRLAGHRLGRKALTTFPTPTLEDRLTLPGSHASTESVLFCAATVVGLKRTFHGT